MTKEELIFTIDYNVKSMEFACADDNCFKAHFVDENGETFDFTASRQKVLEHIERFSAHPERYISNKGLCVATAWLSIGTRKHTYQNGRRNL